MERQNGNFLKIPFHLIKRIRTALQPKTKHHKEQMGEPERNRLSQSPASLGDSEQYRARTAETGNETDQK